MNQVTHADGPQSKMVAFKRELGQMADQLPQSKDIPIEKMKSAITVAVQQNPKLLDADRSTLWQSARKCSADGLLPDGREAAFVLFKTKIDGRFVDAVQYIPMVYGLRKRAMNSGDIKDIDSYLVYEGEWTNNRFFMQAGDDPKIEHRPIVLGAPGEPERGEPIGAYAIATFRNGDKVREWMPAVEIDKRRRAAPSQKVYKKGEKPSVSDEPLGVWKDWRDEQWKKTLIRAISKKLPLSSDDQRMIQESEPIDLPRDITPEEEKPRNLAQRLMEPEPETVTGEIMHDEPHWTESIDASEAFPGDDAFGEGAKAAQADQPATDCPYEGDRDKAVHWLGGWHQAQEARS